MTFNINEFIANGLNGNGARPSHFHVDLFLPFASEQAKRLKFACFATSLPGFSINQAPVYYFGRMIKLSGDRVFEDWDVMMYNDTDFAARAALEKWSNDINALISNRMNPEVFPNGYKTSAEVTQYAQDGEALRTYRFNGLWPAVVAPIQLDYRDGSQVEVFQVRFSVDHFEPIDQSSALDQYNPILPDDGQVSGNPLNPLQ